LLPDWSGIDVPTYRTVSAKFRWNSSETRASDYDRACDVDDYIGVLSVGHGEGLVLGDVPSATRWFQHESGIYLVRWEYAENDTSMEHALSSIPARLPWEHKGTFTVVSSPLELFNAGEPGMERLSARLRLELAPGSYDLWWTRYAPDERTAAGLIALRPGAA
jgi:hypothetical protein